MGQIPSHLGVIEDKTRAGVDGYSAGIGGRIGYLHGGWRVVSARG